MNLRTEDQLAGEAIRAIQRGDLDSTPLEIASTAGHETGREALVSWLCEKGAQGAAK